ncbi:MAG: 30S ribosomal protein S19 [Candidatus Pacearchaeota archaeon]|nr:MAG: 30S ribosomal protein S19 [Candidatus Pacearchaeota archaeon]
METEKEEIKRKEFTYRGKNIEELKKLSVREVAKFLKSRSRRYVLNQFHKVEDFIRRANKKISLGKPIRTHYRDMVIMPQMIGMKIFVHNGKNFVAVDVTEEMIGHRLGEFAITRQKIKHSKAGIGATKGTKFKAKK